MTIETKDNLSKNEESVADLAEKNNEASEDRVVSTGLIEHSNELGEVRTLKKKFSRTNYALMATHGISNVVSVFVTVFLVSYIYSISSNYIVDIGLFYFSKYLVMAVVYFLVSNIIDRTNRAIIYKISLIIHGLFMLMIVLFGKNLAQLILLAGSLYGISDAFYWASYNVMKNELVPNKLTSKNSAIQFALDKFMNIVIPISLGKLIDADSFKTSAIVVLVLVFVQFMISLMIRSKRPEDSSFKMREFIDDVKNLGDKKKYIKIVLILSGIYAFYTMLAPLETVLVMLVFDSNFSLGIAKSIFSVFSMISVFMLLKVFKFGKRSWVFILSAVLCPLSAILMALATSKTTIIIYGLMYAIFSMTMTFGFDVIRNSLLKKFNMYRDIAEFQCAVEMVMNVCRAFAFLMLVAAGFIGAGFGVSGLMTAAKIMLVISIFSITIMDIILLKTEKSLVRDGIM